jgi:hypothetical protein
MHRLQSIETDLPPEISAIRQAGKTVYVGPDLLTVLKANMPYCNPTLSYAPRDGQDISRQCWWTPDCG